ncbi:metal-dependent hydrolase [uncultured Amphritea sp.]|uniref:metal-dependent hydrolase n=1 Tax=uncultured Amphritea sp. TaxID=981605 RepID=UPI0025D5FA67|nr:metal-dependent hydrolase [uncultured Amphritea sp.]
MNAINHAATALLINRKWPGVPIIPVFISVQVIEFIWVVLNIAGVETTTTEPVVRALNDIHLTHMPYSHSVVTAVIIAVAVWWVFSSVLNRPAWGVALAVGVLSHIILDIATHVQDIAISPWNGSAKLGLGLYSVPSLALLIETFYGVGCWWFFRGTRKLLAFIIVFNLAALSFYSLSIPGPEQFFAGRAQLFAAFVGVHIMVGLGGVGVLAHSRWRTLGSAKVLSYLLPESR